MPRQKKPVDPCYTEFVRVWMEEYPTRFTPTTGKKIKELIADTKWRMQSKGKPVDDVAKVTAAFAYVIKYVKRVNHFANKKPITTFQGQYLSIIDEIESGKRIKQTQPSTRDFINSL